MTLAVIMLTTPRTLQKSEPHPITFVRDHMAHRLPGTNNQMALSHSIHNVGTTDDAN
jgi:hypothetical protein